MKRSNEDARSKQIFFTARVKNKREQTKLSYELKLMDRQFGHTIYDIHREIRDLKSELKVTKRSSGRSSEGWFPGSDGLGEDFGPSSTDRRAKSSTSVGRRRRRREEVRNSRDYKRISSAPADGGTRKTQPQSNSTNAGYLAQTQKSTAEPGIQRSGEGSMTPQSFISRKRTTKTTATTPIFLQNKMGNKQHLPSTGLEHGACDSLDNANDPITSVAGVNSDEISRCDENRKDDANRVRNSLTPSSEDEGVRPLTEKMAQRVKERWIKPALKTEGNDKSNNNNNRNKLVSPKKSVHIALNSTSEIANVGVHERQPQNSPMLPIKNTAKQNRFASKIKSTFMTNPVTPTPQFNASGTSPLSAMLGTLMSGSKGHDSRPKSANVIPDVRKKTLSTEEKEMKKKRDRLLVSSVSALLSGNALGKPKSDETDGQKTSKNDARSEGVSPSPSAADDSSRSGSPLRRRFSFRSITLLAMNQKSMTVEQKSTLGSRLKLKPPERKVDIKKSVQVNDSDSDDENNDYAPPPKPAIDLKNVKSKISGQWKQDAALEKPPTLSDDTFQLQRSLAAAHISRERDLRLMQDDNEVDPVSLIENDRKSALMSKFKAFNNSISAISKKDDRKKSIMDAIHSGRNGNQILKLLRAANSTSSS